MSFYNRTRTVKCSHVWELHSEKYALVVNGVKSTVVLDCDSVRDGTYFGFQLYHDQAELTHAITVVVTQEYFKLRFCLKLPCRRCLDMAPAQKKERPLLHK
jgi:hypothetical protein